MASDGQQTLDGGEVTDPRITKAGQALWWEDARRTWGRDGREPDGTLVATSKARCWTCSAAPAAARSATSEQALTSSAWT
jgi:hypothetical protein